MLLGGLILVLTVVAGACANDGRSSQVASLEMDTVNTLHGAEASNVDPLTEADPTTRSSPTQRSIRQSQLRDEALTTLVKDDGTTA